MLVAINLKKLKESLEAEDNFTFSYFYPLGKQGWRSGESNHLPPMWPGFDSRFQCHKWVQFVLVLYSAPRLLSESSAFPPLSKKTSLYS